jgi:hypothetical protein
MGSPLAKAELLFEASNQETARFQAVSQWS